jgi:glucosamine-6-phosphate deaminase
MTPHADQPRKIVPSAVEAAELARGTPRVLRSPTERIPVIEVESFPLLGRLAALRFVEWVLDNPGGVIALPTGKTPEHFIAWVARILTRWDTPEIRTLLAEHGLRPKGRPEMQSLTFVQIDEFYPMNARQHNSFYHYVTEYYIRNFGLDPAKALLIDATTLGLLPGMTMAEVFPDNSVDLSLRVRHTRTDLERLQKEVVNRVDMFCTEYETRIRSLGGIGFFLGGIGPDGHIAFNVRGSSIYSVTRLTGTNYETQAAAAGDLGGIEISRNRLVITIGLATITVNPASTVIIMAAGDAKAQVVRDAVEQPPHQQYPASVLQGMPNARFYLTRGAARLLTRSRLERVRSTPRMSEEEADGILIDIALARNTPLLRLDDSQIRADERGNLLLSSSGLDYRTLAEQAHRRIVAKIERGLEQPTGTTFLHTEPHQDDVMLAYLAYIYHLVRVPDNKHCFANLTSGFTSVSNAYFLSILEKLEPSLDSGKFSHLLAKGYFSPGNPTGQMEEVYLFLDGTAARNQEKRDEAEARRLLRNLVERFGTNDLPQLRLRVKELIAYLRTQYPGAKDPVDVQTLKGTLREWEAELLWAYFGIEAKDVHALRLGFYRGELFSEEPELQRDVLPIFELIRSVRPQVISVAFDPEGSGPDTHYKALQAVAEAVKMYKAEKGAELRIWGYRNVWYRFTPAEANIMVPVSLNTLSLLHSAFMNCFGSQSAASFPSYEHDGPFSELAATIQVEQYAVVKTCLGDDFFLNHPHPRLRAARGLIFLREMFLPEFYEKVRHLRSVTEAKE